MRLLRPLLILGAACTLVVSLSGQTVRVLSVSGEATLQAPGDSAPRTVRKGDTIVVGTRIITGEGARVILTPLPGVNSIIAPKSEVVVERVSVSTPPGAKTALHSAVLDLKTGAVTTDLKPTQGVELDYGVRTARGLAGARGTTYTVGINAAGIQTIVVADGRISLTLDDGRVVSLVPGQVSITKTDGSTQAVDSASDLSTGDQAIADNWVETTLDALAEAIEQGIDIDPAALDDAIRAATELGIDVDAETQARLDRARQLLEQRRDAALQEQLDNSTTGGDTQNKEIVTGTANNTDTNTDDPALAAYLATLTEEQRRAFEKLIPEDLKPRLVAANDSVLNGYALALGDGEVLAHPVPSIRYVAALATSTLRSAFLESPSVVQDTLLAHPSDATLAKFALTPDTEGVYRPSGDVQYFATLSGTQRNRFLALSASIQSDLVGANDPALTDYALGASRSAAEIAFFGDLGSTDRNAFLLLAPAAQAALVAANDPALNTYAFATGRRTAEIVFAADLTTERRAKFLGLEPDTQLVLVTNSTDNQLLGFALDPYGDNQFHDETDIAYFVALPSAHRTAFLALPLDTQGGLIAAADPTLNAFAFASGRTATEIDYALALPAERRSLFLTYSPAAQNALVANSADTGLAEFAYATNEGGGNLHSHEAIAFYAGLTATERTTYEARPLNLQEIAATDATFAPLVLALDASNEPVYSDATLGHYLLLAPATRADYLERPADVRDQFAALGKPALTAAVLDDTSFDEPPTDADLRRNLNALLALSPENQILFETFAGGPAYPKLESAPGPYEWSDAAWTRTRNSFTALAPTTQTRLLNLGAIEGLFDYSATFIDAALIDYDSSLPATTRNAIQTAGWGRYFANYFANEEFRATLALAGDFSDAELSTLKAFDISPYAFSSEGSTPASTEALVLTSSTEGRADAKANLAILADPARPAADRALLRSLAAGDHILFASLQGYYDPETESYVDPTYADTLANALAFAREFTPDQQQAIRLLDLGHLILNHRGDDALYIGDSPTTVRERLNYLLSLYQGLDDAQRDTVRDTGLFSAAYHELDLNEASLPGIIQAWEALAPATRDFLASSVGDGLNLFSLSASGALQDLDTLLSALSDTELAILREMRTGNALLDATFNESLPGLAEVTEFTGFIASLGDTQRFTLNELGITGEDNARQGLFSADREGLDRLLQAYADLPGDLRAATRQVKSFHSYRSYTGRSFFFADDNGSDYATYNVTFTSPDDLHVGAVRHLSLLNDSYASGTTFSVPAGKDIYLRASSLIDLDGVSFSSAIRTITMEAATINLSNLDFPGGSQVMLYSKLGGTGTGGRYPNFGYSEYGRVNFITNVRYGGVLMFDEASFDAASQGRILINTLSSLKVPITPTTLGGGSLAPSN